MQEQTTVAAAELQPEIRTKNKTSPAPVAVAPAENESVASAEPKTAPEPAPEKPRLPKAVKVDVVNSDCGTYTYSLAVRWNFENPSIVFIGLVAADTDDWQQDAELKRMAELAYAWGYGGMVVLNLFALRSNNRKDVLTHPSPIGPENDHYIELQTIHYPHHRPVVFAWGVALNVETRVKEIVKLFPQALCMGISSEGYPLTVTQAGENVKLLLYEEAINK